MNRLLTKVGFYVFIITFFSCEKDGFENIIKEDAQIPFKQIKYSELPNSIKSGLVNNSKILKQNYLYAKDDERKFGDIIVEDSVNVVTKDGYSYYTARMENIEKGLYFDNAVVKLDSLGEIKSVSTLRYEPSEEWLQHTDKENRYEYYSGDLKIFDQFGNRNAVLSFFNGSLVKSNINRSTNSCEILEVQYEIGCAYDCFISEINILITCTASGNEDSSNGSDSNTNEDISPGEGSLGGGITSNPIETEFLDPCKQMAKLESDSELISKLLELKSKTDDNREYAYYLYNGKNTYFSPLKSGPPNGGEISLTPTSTIDGLLHSHYRGLYSIFSGADIRWIYEIYKRGKMRKWKNFIAIVVTNETVYSLKIDDINKFIAYGDLYFSSDGAFKDVYERLYIERIKTTNTTLQNELGLLDLLSLNDGSGLKLFKGNPLTFTSWTGIKPNLFKNGIINDNCK
ncbi:hypothetical protein [uncultured Croceitalea sp.]|uniref:hypothetical protein n=1 Tax=uncultured Croceitalea sp. TaxID=1798908 RepID=UPI003305A346